MPVGTSQGQSELVRTSQARRAGRSGGNPDRQPGVGLVSGRVSGPTSGRAVPRISAMCGSAPGVLFGKVQQLAQIVRVDVERVVHGGKGCLDIRQCQGCGGGWP